MKKIITTITILISSVTHAQYSGESEVNVLLTGGNSEVKTYTGKSTNKYGFTEKDLVEFGGHYTYGTSAGVESARHWDVNAKYERTIIGNLAGFLGEQVLGNKFAGITDQYNTDLGFSYHIYKSEKNETKSELGYRYTVNRRKNHETGEKLSTEHSNKARIHLETETKHSEDLSSKLWAEYIPNFSEGSDWNVNIEGSVSMALSKMFSMKAAHLWKYDNFPVVGNARYDYQTSFSLLAKF